MLRWRGEAVGAGKRQGWCDEEGERTHLADVEEKGILGRSSTCVAEEWRWMSVVL